MIELPNLKDMYSYETNYHLTLDLSRLAKFIAHYEAYNRVRDVPGAIVECGVFKGTSLTRFALLRDLLGNNFSCRIIGFDVFSDDYPDTTFEEDKPQREHWINTAGPSSISVPQLTEVFTRQGIRNVELVSGDICRTVPRYVKDHPSLKVCLLNIDCDFVEPTLCALQHFYPLMPKGGIVLLDNYAGEGTSGDSCFGDTKGTDDYFGDKDVRIQRFPFGSRPCFIVKG